MKKKVSTIWTGSVISIGIVSLGTVVAVCIAPPLAIPFGAKLGASVLGLVGTAWAAGDTAVNHFSDCIGAEQNKEEDYIEELKRRLTSLEERCEKNTGDMQNVNQKFGEMEVRQNTLEIQHEKDKREQTARISLIREDVDSQSRKISTFERRMTSHTDKAPTVSSGAASSSTQTDQEQTDTIPENVSTLLSKHGLHSSNQSEFRPPSDASSASKRRNPTNLRM
ncbi:hypothetical protein J2N86_09880 [Legionella lytica]|uniref:Uncharacterized protein n=1 Tax=Legionella lytica TaxID=96232 RepID=A0ABY4Y6C9_9GAMM|nr:hypothetical protein [Legionella lytica]USQ13011.1 hypothetical protein J2N86_09880 [Legionella lytica]